MALFIPITRITLSRLVAPLAMVTEERGISKIPARNSITALLALPSTGGAVREIFRASPAMPVIAVRLARGWTLTENVTSLAVSRTGIIAARGSSRQISPYRRARRLSPLRSQPQNHGTCPWKACPSGCKPVYGKQSFPAGYASCGNKAEHLQGLRCTEEWSSGRRLEDVRVSPFPEAVLPAPASPQKCRSCFLH